MYKTDFSVFCALVGVINYCIFPKYFKNDSNHGLKVYKNIYFLKSVTKRGC